MRTASTSTVTSSVKRKYASEAAPESSTFSVLGDNGEVEISEEEYATSIEHGRSLHEPNYHPRTHGIPAATIHLRSYHISLLQLFTHFVAHAAAALAIPISKPVPLPIQRSLWTVLKGPFVHKKAQENFSRKTHKRVIKAWDTDPEVVERWVRYLEKHALAGVGIRVVRWERAPVGVGKKVSDTVKAAMENAKLQTPKGQVEALGGKILEQELATASKEQILVQQPEPVESA
ncbi:uncharacterized protein PHACADRAFT_200369 [Phanerochaete carnosa HHB-10118-sp]|uniref:Small ribosomal subunit protein uS10m n=1 Tax=Phanerochaete carnosa (strain HHB-10118-sp) TaxID=650164 RepID=K5VUF6_PHACS|nr:uncharacterized protein PHACADRAFT_200369 [Phanerochaete carnosa HHB-10118-sp]EKM50425.1 hypothetical protein PHACADRAFT_200369 [Phanerochaete carnosa HHB-10118-sp]